ncbi:MAG: hypothetical protein VYE81_00540 [Planctomycetota bacterium]|nr:hypothetical protein [Planctomycetota bacterium]
MQHREDGEQGQTHTHRKRDKGSQKKQKANKNKSNSLTKGIGPFFFKPTMATASDVLRAEVDRLASGSHATLEARVRALLDLAASRGTGAEFDVNALLAQRAPDAPLISLDSARAWLRARSLQKFSQCLRSTTGAAARLALVEDQLGDPRCWPAEACELSRGLDFRASLLADRWDYRQRFAFAKFLVGNGVNPEVAWEIGRGALRDASAERHFASLLGQCEPSFCARTHRMRWDVRMRPLLPRSDASEAFWHRYGGTFDLVEGRWRRPASRVGMC